MPQVQIQITSESVLFLPLSFFTLGEYNLILTRIAWSLRIVDCSSKQPSSSFVLLAAFRAVCARASFYLHTVLLY